MSQINMQRATIISILLKQNCGTRIHVACRDGLIAHYTQHYMLIKLYFIMEGTQFKDFSAEQHSLIYVLDCLSDRMETGFEEPALKMGSQFVRLLQQSKWETADWIIEERWEERAVERLGGKLWHVVTDKKAN